MDLENDEYLNLIALVSNTLEAFTAAFFILRKKGEEELLIRAIHTLSNNVDEKVQIKIGQGPIGWVAKTGQALNISDFKRDIKALALYTTDEHIKSFLAVPIIKNAILGVLMIDSKRQFAFSNKEQKILYQFACQFAHLMTRDKIANFSDIQSDILSQTANFLQSITRLSEKADFLEALEEKLADLIPYDSFITSVCDKDKPNRYKVIIAANTRPNKIRMDATYSMNSGLIGWILRKKSPLFLKALRQERAKSYIVTPNEVSWELGSFIGTPIKTKGETIGAISIGSKERNKFTKDDYNILKIISCGIGSTLYLMYFH